MRILGIVPARAGSKRIPGKNLRRLGGKTLVEFAIELGLACPSLTDVVVSTDAPLILQLTAGFPRAIALARPAELAADDSPAIDYVRHALDALERSRERYDAVVILQPSSPLTVPEDVEGTIGLLLATGAETAVSVVRVAHDVHPVKMKRLDGDRLLPYLEDESGRMASHELPALYVRNCSVYATRRDVIDSGRILGDDCRGFVMPRERSVDVNEDIDLAFAEFLFARSRAEPSSDTGPDRPTDA